MAAGGDWPVSREQPGVGKCPDGAQRAEIVAQWRGDGSRLQADRGRDVREDMVACEQQPVLVVEVDEVAPRVPRGGLGVQAALADGKKGPRLEPRVRLLPCRVRYCLVRQQRKDLVGQFRRAAAAQVGQLLA